MYQRIVRSYRVRRQLDTGNTKLCSDMDTTAADIGDSWRRLERFMTADTISCSDSCTAVGGGQQCGVCLEAGAELESGSSFYHPGCANYWVNCVRDTLPCLK